MTVKTLCYNPNSNILMLCAAKRLVLLGFIGCCLVSSSQGAPDSIGAATEVVTSLAELNQLTNVGQSLTVAVQLEGTVWWSSKTEGRVILKDDTAVVQLELGLPCQMPRLGDRLILEGDCTVIKARDFIKILGVPVVENGGLHPPEEKSGTIHLNAGRHPIRAGC